MIKKNIGEVLIFIFSVSAYLFFLFGLNVFYKDYPKILSKPVDVVVKDGDSAYDLAVAAQSAGVVASARNLARELSALGIDRRIAAGTYRLHRSTAYCVAREIERTKPISDKVTLIPGAKYKDVLSLISGRDKNILSALNDVKNFPEEMRDYLPISPKSRIAFILPETYFTVKNDGEANEFVKAASVLWFKRVGRKILPANKNVYAKTASLASLVESEAMFDDERALIAGVLRKRIEMGMRLQCDASVIYAWEEKGIKKQKLSYKDLEIISPYNTYKNEGLPPGPICVPSQSSWIAALMPKKTDYLYYFADKNGRHIFSKTYEEHLRKQKGVKR